MRALFLALALASPLAAAANVSLLQISTDPYTNPTSQHRTELEPDTFAFGSTIVSTFQVGRFFDGGASNIGFATSTNGGASWTNGFLPGTTVFATPPGPYQRASDPVVAFDARHNVWLASYLGIINPANGPVDAGELADLKSILNRATTLNIPAYVQALAGDIINGESVGYGGEPMGMCYGDNGWVTFIAQQSSNMQMLYAAHPVPEPSVIALLATGLVALLGLVRPKRR